MSTHNLCFRANIRKYNEYPSKLQFYYKKGGCMGGLHYMDIQVYLIITLSLGSIRTDHVISETML